MNDKVDNVNLSPDSSKGDILANVSGAVVDYLTGTTIPAPIRKNAFKAFGQLCTAAVDIPVSHLEGLAAEKRAETQARIKIISTSADQIAAQMNVEPEYAHAAVKKYSQKIIREQLNLDKISETAAEKLKQDSVNSNVDPGNVNDATINDDWLNDFEREASQKSTEEMQLLFGRILAGEIQRPSSFSIKTVKLLGSLDASTASLFRRLCSLSISWRFGADIIDARVVSLKGSAASNSLQGYGLSFDQLNILHEYGLIISDYNSYSDYRMCIADSNHVVPVPLIYKNREWGFIPSSDTQTNGELKLSGVALSRSGKELLTIVEIEAVEQYSTSIQEYFAKKGLQMVEISIK